LVMRERFESFGIEMQSETMSNAAECVTEMGRISEKERGVST